MENDPSCTESESVEPNLNHNHSSYLKILNLYPQNKVASKHPSELQTPPIFPSHQYQTLNFSALTSSASTSTPPFSIKSYVTPSRLNSTPASVTARQSVKYTSVKFGDARVPGFSTIHSAVSRQSVCELVMVTLKPYPWVRFSINLGVVC